jgi:anti-sigma-K factor RskA
MRDEIAAYALGALDEGAGAKLEEHLAECEECAAYLRWLQPAVDQLPASVPQLEPPPQLGRRLAETVRGEAQRLRAGEDEPGGSRWRSWRGIAWRPATALAALALLAVGAVGGWLASDSGSEAEVIVAEATGGEPVDAALHRGGAAATLQVDAVPPLGRDDVYQVWVQRNGELNPSSTFVLDDDGSGDAVVEEPLEGAEAVLVTAEPRGGSESPTSPPILRAPLD